jgi:ribonucleoside-diphosphate reductase alpha chain
MGESVYYKYKLPASALRVLEEECLVKNRDGKAIETPGQLFRRVARNIAEVDRLYGPQADLGATEEIFYRLLSEIRFLPDRGVLLNAGRYLQRLLPCFILPIGDSSEETFEALRHTEALLKTGRKIGLSFSRLQPKGQIVPGTNRIASGPVFFKKVFEYAARTVQNASKWRWANRIVLRVDHPDILEFLSDREETGATSLFKISIAVTDKFMEAYEKGEKYDLIVPGRGDVIRRLPAGMVMRQIAARVIETGEPDLFFIDRANETNSIPHLGAIEATDPCAGQPLLPYEGCNLGSIYLERHLGEVDGRYRLNWHLLEKTVRTAVHFLDNVVDVVCYQVSKMEIVSKDTRKIGLGVIGFGRMLYKLGIPYHTEKGLDMARAVMSFIRDVGHDASARLAGKRGVYAGWEGSLHAERGQKMRNACVTAISSAGTLSRLAQTSAGCEPEPSLIQYAPSRDGARRPSLLWCFVKTAKKEGFWRDDFRHSILENHGSVQGIFNVPKPWQEIFVTARDVPLAWHVQMQGAFQEFTDGAVSIPLCLSQEASIDELMEAYLLAYRLKCKGVAV